MSKNSTNLLTYSSGGEKFKRSRWAQIRVLGGQGSSLMAPGEHLFACFLQLLEATPTPWFVGPSAICKANNRKPNLSCTSSLWNTSLLRLEGRLWLPSAHLDHPAYTQRRKVSWSAILIPPATWMPLCLVTQHIHSFWELEGGHLWTRDYFASYSAYLFWSVVCFSFLSTVNQNNLKIRQF